MCAAQLAGGLIVDGLPHILFVFFAIVGGTGLFIMADNLYLILTPVDEK